jgi:hypothetical protein
MITPFEYREEDRFREESNKRKLKELYRKGDYIGLLDFAILLNHEVCYKNSGIAWVMRESLEANQTRQGGDLGEYLEMVDETIEKMIELKTEKSNQSAE